MDQVLIYDIESQVASECAGEQEKGVSEYRKEQKETDISDVPHSKIIQVRPPTFKHQEPIKRQEEQSQEHENIIFYEDDLTKSTNTIDIDQTNRCLLKNQQDDEQESNSEEYDEVEELQHEQPIPRRGRVGIMPQQTHLKNQTVVVQANTDLFIKQVVPLNFSITCVIAVERNLLGLVSCYRLFLQQGEQFLLSAKKQVFKFSSSFIVSRHPTHIHKRSTIYQGRLEGNFIGTEYRLFAVKDQIQTLKLVLTYEKNIIGFNGPRNFTATKLSPDVQPSFKNSLQGVIQRNEKSKLMELETAKPILKKGKFRIDFGGKVKMPSAKNFILELVVAKGQRKRSLLFGKIKDDRYVMQVQYPLTIFEAFGICLTSLDSKLMVN